MSTTLDYRTPQPSPPDPERIAQLRTMARVLAVGATLWALFCAWFIIAGSWRALLTLGPGYVITVGYYWRAFGRPSPNWCRAIWGLSLLVQGAWLGWVVLAMFSGPLGGGPFGLLMLVWWTAATLLSLIALLMEPGGPAAV